VKRRSFQLSTQLRTQLRIVVVYLLLAPTSHAAPPPHIESIHFLIPGGAGGGWDRTARGVGQALTESGLVGTARYENMSGGGGAKGIAHVIELNDPNMLLVNSTPIVVRALQKIFPQSFRDLTPIASTIGDYSVIAVRAQSDIQSLRELAARQRKNPKSMAIAGGSVTGGTDHIVAAMVIKGFGGDPKTTKYIPYDAGGKAMAGLLSGEVQALSSGFGEVADLVQQGWVRILCTASEHRLSRTPDTPTCIEAGSESAVFVNWRGFFATPDLSHERATAYRQVLASMYEQKIWSEIRERNGWVDIFHPGEEFTRMLESQELIVGNLMRELGLL
jgi:putative tricarboxylic transport membrane protein